MKGEYGQECNITSCQKPNSAYWFNHSTHKYYCEECANRLNNDEFNKRDAQRLFGHDLCTYDKKPMKIAVVGSGLDSQHLIRTVKEKTVLTDYLHNMINESEELTYYARYFGGLMKENPTAKTIKNLPPKELEREYNLIQEKKSNRSKRERDLIVYYYENKRKSS